MSGPIIFLDDGGVITDRDRRTAEWQRLVGEVMVSLLGGTAEGWAEAHQIITARLFEFAREQAYIQATPNFVSFYRTHQVEWIAQMCALVRHPIPSEAACFALAERAAAAITKRTRAALPGAAEGIRALRHAGYILHTASGSASEQLAGCLDGMGVRCCFGRLYGADLINTFKEGPEYYERIFADAGIAPAEALVVDDSPQAIGWAAQTGARTVLVHAVSHHSDHTDQAGPAEPGMTPRIGALTELLTFLQRMG